LISGDEPCGCWLLEDLGAELELDFALLEDFALELDWALLEDFALELDFTLLEDLGAVPAPISLHSLPFGS
jgi:hypothetical protein